MLLRSLHVLKAWKTKLVLALSWQIGQNVFKTQMFLKLGYRFPWTNFHCSENLFSETKTKSNQTLKLQKFDKNLFRNDLLSELLWKNVQTKHLDSFKATAQNVFDRHAPLKEKHVRCNQAAFVNKNLRKAIMTRSRWFNKFRHEGTRSSHVAYKKQRNVCVKLLRKTKKKIFNNVDVKRVADNKQFWKTVKPCLTIKL